MSACSYPSITSIIYEATHLIPWIVPLVISAASIGRDRNGKWGKQIIMIWYGLYLTFCQILLYIVQTATNATRMDPYCIDVVTYAFPSTEGFYVAALSTYVMAFTYLWNIELSWTYWSILFTFVLGPCGILIWYTYNTVVEIAISIGLGVGTTLIFLLCVRFLWLEHIHFMLRQAPWTWFNAIDTYVMSDEQLRESELLEWEMESLENQG